MVPAQFELAGLFLREFHEFVERVDAERGRHADRDQRIGDARDRHQVLRLIGQLGVDERMRGEGRGRRHQEGMIVIRRQERIDRDDGVAARPVLDHDRLAPFGRELVGEQARGDVDAAAGPERQDQRDVALRPGLAGACACDASVPSSDRGNGEQTAHESFLCVSRVFLSVSLSPRCAGCQCGGFRVAPARFIQP